MLLSACVANDSIAAMQPLSASERHRASDAATTEQALSTWLQRGDSPLTTANMVANHRKRKRAEMEMLWIKFAGIHYAFCYFYPYLTRFEFSTEVTCDLSYLRSYIEIWNFGFITTSEIVLYVYAIQFHLCVLLEWQPNISIYKLCNQSECQKSFGHYK